MFLQLRIKRFTIEEQRIKFDLNFIKRAEIYILKLGFVNLEYNLDFFKVLITVISNNLKYN